MVKISDVLKTTAERLKKADIDTASLDARLLLCEYLKRDKLYLIVHSDEEIAVDEAFEKLVARRENHEPMQYILGKAEFYGLEFVVNENVLIPRPDTEILVERVIDFVGNNPYTVLDIGTGSGCIPITVAANCENVRAITVDISKEATAVAKKNARLNGVEERVSFLNMDILNSFPYTEVECIVSNPPYIEDDVVSTLMSDVKDYEPQIALKGGADGLVFYRRIAEKGFEIIKDGGLIAFEVGYDQARAVSLILEGNGFTDIITFKDFAGIERVVCGTKRI